MEWNARTAALDLHRGLDLNQQNQKVMAYFAGCLQEAYHRGRNDALDQLEAGQPIVVAKRNDKLQP